MIRAILHSAADLFNSDGAFWILALDGILLVPLIFAVFFYPVPVLASIGGIVLATLVVMAVRRALHRHRHRPRVM